MTSVLSYGSRLKMISTFMPFPFFLVSPNASHHRQKKQSDEERGAVLFTVRVHAIVRLIISRKSQIDVYSALKIDIPSNL